VEGAREGQSTSSVSEDNPVPLEVSVLNPEDRSARDQGSVESQTNLHFVITKSGLEPSSPATLDILNEALDQIQKMTIHENLLSAFNH
jgi:hypothetical protein